MVSNIARGTYEERLRALNLTTLEERRWRIMTGKNRVDASTWFDMEADRPREGAIRPKEFMYKERGRVFLVTGW